MLNYREKRTLLILSIISVALSLVACVPFTLAKLTQFELIVKYIVLPISVAVMSIVCYSIKYRNYRPAYRFSTVTGYLPVLSYSVALAINTLVVLLRSNQVFSLNVWVGLVVILAFYIIGSIALIHLFLEKIVVFSKNEIMVIDSLFIAVLAIDAIIFGVVSNKFVDLSEPFSNASWVFIIVPLLIAAGWLAFHILHLVKLYKTDAELVLVNKNELVKKFYKAHEDYYAEAQDVILNALHEFTGAKLGAADEGLEENEELVIVEEEAQEVIESEVEEVSEAEKEVVVVKDEADAKRIAELEEALEKLHAEKNELHETHSEHLENAKAEAENAKAEAEVLKAAEAARLAAEVAEAEKKAKAAEERAAAVAKAKKAIKPSFQKLVTYASELEKDGSVEVVSNDKENQYKFYYNKKLFLALIDSNVDYRIMFLCERESAIDLIINHPGVVVKAKSPKGPNWYKLTNKGTFEEKELKQVIKESLKTYKKMEAEAAAEKERIKAEKAAARKAEKEAAKAAK